jgi:hypothetical protein
MRNLVMKLSFAAVIGGALATGTGCGDDRPSSTGAAGIGGVGGAGGGGVAGTVGGAGDATGTGGAVAQSPQEMHDSIINAQTVGGVDVTRTPPTVSYPTCE